MIWNELDLLAIPSSWSLEETTAGILFNVGIVKA
jgi:hypothetical protein